MRKSWIGLPTIALLSACAINQSEADANRGPSANPTLGDPVEHRIAGLLAAESGYPGLASLCGEPSRTLDQARVQSNEWRMPDAVPAAQVFDNLYFVGNSFSSAWVVRTSEGLILIDAVTNAQEVERDIEGGLERLGLDPADIRYLVVSHGHGDHSGGAAYLAEKYDLRIVMSRFDWEASQDPQRRIQLPGWNDVPRPAILIEGEYELTLGRTTITLVETPGHTMGTLSTIVPVTDGFDSHTAVIWGGTGFNFGPVLAQYQAYANSAEAMRNRVLRYGIDVFLSNHVARDRTVERLAALFSRIEGAPHPFVTSSENLSRAFEGGVSPMRTGLHLAHRDL